MDIYVDALSHHRIGEGLRDPLAVAPVGDLLPECLAVVLGVGVLDMGEKLRALMHQVHSPAQQVPSGAHVLV